LRRISDEIVDAGVAVCVCRWYRSWSMAEVRADVRNILTAAEKKRAEIEERKVDVDVDECWSD